MNQFDTTVGQGIGSLLQQNQEKMGEPGGAFNFAPKNEPVLKMARGGLSEMGDYISEDTSYLPEVVSTGDVAGSDPLTQTLQSSGMTPEAKTEAPKSDIVGDLTAAGLQETKPSITATTAPTVTASNLIQQFKQSNPQFGEGFDYSTVGRTSDEGDFGSIQAPTSEFGGYTVKAIGSFDENDLISGAYTPGKVGGYEATKSDMQANGKPLISTLKYDASGALTGRTVRAYEGSDSGTEFYLDAAGNIVSASKFDESEAWKQTAIPLLQMAALATAPYLQGAGLFTKAAAGAGFGAANAALHGKEGSDLLKAAAIGGAGSAVGAGLGEAAGKAAGEFAGNLFTNPDVASVASQAARGAVESGIKALPGAIATGDTGRLVSGALTGGALGAASSLTGDIDLPFTKQQAEAGINLIRAVNSGNMVSAANSAAALINNPDITIATRAATLLKAMQSGNVNAVMAAAQMLGNTVAQSSKTSTKTAEAPGGAFETSAIIDEFGDYGGTIVPGEAGESVNVFGTRSPSDIALDYFFSPEDTTVNQRVGVKGTKFPVEGLSDVADLESVLNEDPNRVNVTGSRIIPSLTGADLQSVGVEGTRFPVEGLGDTTDLESVLTEDPNRVDVTGKTIKPDDVTNQTVGVTSTRLPKEEVKETPSTTTTTTPTTTKPTTKIPTLPKKPTATPSAFTPIQEAAAQQPVRPGVVTDAYEVLFGAGAPSLMGFTKAERAKQILARKREEEENEPETPYDRLMAMADRDPVGTVDQLMKIVNGESA